MTLTAIATCQTEKPNYTRIQIIRVSNETKISYLLIKLIASAWENDFERCFLLQIELGIVVCILTTNMMQKIIRF